ncbi:MAG: DUF2059 domain-containing protein [Acidobacteriaceae bacterium]|nr:DUF2059 domain-containing protein [Acidobacteriaceae bacterium]
MKLPVLFFLLCLPSVAQVTTASSSTDAATKEQIQKLFDVMQIREQSHRMMDSVQKQMQAMSTQTIKTRYPQITAAELARANRITEDSLKQVPMDAILDDMIPIYQKHLSQTDVDAMIVFYSSPTGKKLMQEMPAITQEAMAMSYQHMQKQIDDVLQRVDESMQEDEQRKPAKRSTANPN